MRGLNLLQARTRHCTKDAWEVHQYEQIKCGFNDVEGAESIRPVFPGSMLFNQILIPVEGDVVSRQLLPESCSVEFQYCNHIHSKSKLLNTVVIDVGDFTENAPIDALIALIERDPSIDSITLLGKSASAALSELTDRLSANLEFTVIEPAWNSLYEMHCVYRAARHVIFIDTMRVLDASYTGCSSTLIASEQFRSDITFDLLLRQLDKTGCTVYDFTGEIIYPHKTSDSFIVAQNSIESVKISLLNGAQNDWLDYFTNACSTPVIALPDRASNGFWSSVKDKKTRIQRKAQKLQQDPVAFLADSNLGVLRALSKLNLLKSNRTKQKLPSRKAG